MKKNIYSTVLLLFALFVLSHCSSPKSLLNKGDYYQASISAIQKLRSSPNNANAQTVIVQAYPLALQLGQRAIANAQLRNDVAKYDEIIFQYSQLNNLSNQIYACPKAYELIGTPQEFLSELEQTKVKAAEQFYNQGVNALKNNTIDQARLAYSYFSRANAYSPGYRDVIKKIEEAWFYSTLHVVVYPPQTSMRFQVSADFFYNNLIAEMTRTNQYKFVRFYTPDEARNEGMTNPNQYI
ncbi:MAG: hypothetical protein LBV75_00495, partial [Paludibacter sp.]|nr:hypothetical protein [Paludibacter sp.]